MYLQTIATFKSYRIIYYDVPMIFKIEIKPLSPLYYEIVQNVGRPGWSPYNNV
jgi:hypothetical protein